MMQTTKDIIKIRGSKISIWKPSRFAMHKVMRAIND